MRLLFSLGLMMLAMHSAQLYAEDAALKRVPWTTSHIHGSPEPPKPFVATRVFPQAKFKNPTEVVSYEKGWLVLEQAGKIWWIDAQGIDPEARLLVDLVQWHGDLDNLYGMAVDPDDKSLLYLCYTQGQNKPDGTKVARVRIDFNPPAVPTEFLQREPMQWTYLEQKSERILFTWPSGGHNGGSLQFGADGMLYISTGDSESPSPPDPKNTGQDISDLLSSILRIDVHHPDPGMTYAIPKDNPFVGKMVDTAEHKLKPARGEVWAYGVRNPWKMSFDRATGRLWCADVGWELWESVDLIVRGGNYGWSAMEASQPVRADAPKGPTPITPPVVAHSHDEAASITGGYVYHGKKFPELEGAYVYGDWATGKMWALWYDGKQVTRHEEIADTHHKIVAFGQDADGEIIYADYNDKAGLYALERNKAVRTEKFPVKLSETGLFERGASNPSRIAQIAQGTCAFSIQAPMIQQGAVESEYQLALPGTSMIHTKTGTQKDKTGKEQRTYELLWPKDAVLSRTIGPDPFTKGAPRETQVLHFDGEAWNAYTYQWNPGGSDATLVPAAGTVQEYRDYKGGKHEWRFHSRAECMRCHNSWVGYSLAFKPEQLHGLREDREPSEQENETGQLRALEKSGYVDAKFGQQVLFKLERYLYRSDELAARSFLHANCAHCHRQNAGGAVNMMLNADLPLDQMMAVGVTPQQGGLGLANPKLIDPGNPWNSAICVRLSKMGAGHMPLIGQPEVNEIGLRQVEDWIGSMNPQLYEKAKHRVALNEASIKEMLGTVEGAMELLYHVRREHLTGDLLHSALDQAWRSPNPTVRDLFETFKPEDQRVKTLGTQVDAGALLKMKGDAQHGAQVLSMQGKLAACYACHFINGTGKDFGPDLSHVGSRLMRTQILESVLQPSKVIAPGFAAVVVELKDGSAQTGFVVKEDAESLTMKIATGQSVMMKKSEVAKRTQLPVSLMPEGLMQGLTAQEAADVVAFLEGLK